MSSVWLPLVVFRVNFEVERPEEVPKRLFSSFRGAFGSALKRISCVARSYKSCIECPLNQSCAYGYLFETPKPKDAEVLRKYPFVPHPFAFAPPFPYIGDKILSVRVTLVGKAIDYFPHVILSLEGLGKKGIGPKRVPMKLQSITEEGSGRELFTDGKVALPQKVTPPQAKSIERLKVLFITPTALKFSRRLVRPENFEFHILIRNALRRVSALSYLHVKKPLDIDFKGIISSSERVKTVHKRLKMVSFKRYSARTGNVYDMKGFIGEAEFEGELTEFLQLLTLISFVHVGKSTSFGFGRCEISF